MKNYKCKICGKKHQILRSAESPHPEIISLIPDEEREQRIKEINGFYLVDNKLILGNGYMYIYLENSDDPFFVWTAWASIQLDEFQRSFEELYKEGKIEFKGKLESEFPFYEKSKGLNVKVIVHSPTELILEIVVTEKSKFKSDQLESISKNRVTEIMEKIYHSELHNKQEEFKEPFELRLKAELRKVEIQYLEKNTNFIIDLKSFNNVLFQIVHNEMLESKSKIGRGFGIHLSFDDSFEESKTELKNFKATKYFEIFTPVRLDDVQVFQLNLQEDKSKLEEIVKKILADVYEQKLDTVGIESISA